MKTVKELSDLSAPLETLGEVPDLTAPVPLKVDGQSGKSVLAASIGILTAEPGNKVISCLFPHDTTLPNSEEWHWRTHRPFQSKLELQLYYQDYERLNTSEWFKLDGMYKITLPPGLPCYWPLHVTVTINVMGRIDFYLNINDYGNLPLDDKYEKFYSEEYAKYRNEKYKLVGSAEESLIQPTPKTTVPKDSGYDAVADRLGEETRTFRQRVATELAPALNARIRMPDMPHDTLEEKKELARWVNDQLEPLGLAVQCPNTGLPAKLRGFAGNWPEVGRFAFEVYKDGKRERSAYSDTLPELTLTDANPSLEPEEKWRQTVESKASRSGRRR
jgi:hypothetical protein